MQFSYFSHNCQNLQKRNTFHTRKAIPTTIQCMYSRKSPNLTSIEICVISRHFCHSVFGNAAAHITADCSFQCFLITRSLAVSGVAFRSMRSFCYQPPEKLPLLSKNLACTDFSTSPPSSTYVCLFIFPPHLGPVTQVAAWCQSCFSSTLKPSVFYRILHT